MSIPRGMTDLRESDFQRQVVDLARTLGWGEPYRSSRADTKATRPQPTELTGLIFHPRIMYRSEPGWPDLTLIRRRDRRLIFAELKRDTGETTPRQDQVLELLGLFGTGDWECGNHQPGRKPRPLGPDPRCDECVPWVEVHVWRPRDFDQVAEILR